MIGRIRGVILEKSAPQLLVEVQGLGYEVDAPMSTFFHLPDIGQEVILHTHLNVREDAHTLYGFHSRAERTLFRCLIKVSGIGAKLALTILSGATVEEFSSQVQHQDINALTRIPGIGKKTAERLLIEMRDKIDQVSLEANTQGHAGGDILGGSDSVQDAISALVALGYKPPEASKLVQTVDERADLSSEELIRKALKSAATH
ncbi:Holliday junction ATP-dependent DNA helicase RuvA [hydrothermal vent metagenome]|uniref:Holliday junction ATP-dependent DNA helicase RuvA n=1 Tax=hydrothermal vent metagenome TaxID=652676 RepID=A0A3B0YYY4_9ZZZZ